MITFFISTSSIAFSWSQNCLLDSINSEGDGQDVGDQRNYNAAN